MTAFGHMMLRRTFFAVFLFLFCVTLSYVTKGARGDDDIQKGLTLLRDVKKKMIIYEGRGGEKEVQITSLRSPALIEVEGKAVVVAEARYTNTDKGDYVSVASVTISKDGKLGQISAVLQDGDSADKYPFMLSPTVIADREVGDADLYVYFGGYCRNAQPLRKDSDRSSCSWEPRMLPGYFQDKPSQNDEYIRWDNFDVSVKHDFDSNDLSEYLNSKKIEEFIVSGGAGIQMGDEKYVLPVHVLQKNGSTVSLIITSSDAVENWKFSDGRSALGCTNPAVLELNKNQLFMITTCESGHYKVYESDNEGDNWAEATGTLSGVWGTNKQRNGPGLRGGFTKAKIGKTDVIFFTQPVERTDGSNKYSLNLWMTDLTHIYDVGQISVESKNVSDSSLLYKNPNEDYEEEVNEKNVKFYCAYEVKNINGNDDDVAVVDLADKLKQIKDVVKTWKEVDAKVAERFCMSPQTKGDTSATECKGFEITKGLVGYLSKESLKEDGKWDDEYLCVNTTVSQNARGAVSGFYSTAGKVFKWPENSDGQNQLYHFANKAFTLVATVMINAEPNEKVSLLGVVFKNSEKKNLEEKRYELSYRKNDRWSVTNGNEQKLRNNIDWTADKQYQVVLSREDAKLYVYVDGKPFQEEGQTESTFDIKSEDSFSHFYFGADDTKSSKDVTVTNILLYNRHLNIDEITQNIKKETISTTVTKEKQPVQQEEKNSKVTLQTSSVDAQREVGVRGKDGKNQLPETKSVDLNSATAKGQESYPVIEKVVFPTKSSERPVVVSRREKTDSPTKPADAARRPDGVERQITGVPTTHDISGENAVPVGNEDEDKNKTGEKNTSNSDPHRVTKEKEEPAEATPTLQAKEEKKEATTAPNAAVPEAAGSESPAADNTSLRGTTNAGNHNDTLKTLLETTKGGDGAVRSCVSLLPSLCLWCFLTALHCCQATAA